MYHNKNGNLASQQNFSRSLKGKTSAFAEHAQFSINEWRKRKKSIHRLYLFCVDEKPHWSVAVRTHCPPGLPWFMLNTPVKISSVLDWHNVAWIAESEFSVYCLLTTQNFCSKKFRPSYRPVFCLLNNISFPCTHSAVLSTSMFMAQCCQCVHNQVRF